MAMLLGRIFRVPFVFDMDSSMATQMIDRFSWLRPFGWLLRWLESLPMRSAVAVVPMCEDLAVQARRYCSGIVYVLKDVSLLGQNPGSSSEDLRSHLSGNGPMLMYVGNLEEYQGIDLLLEGFAVLAKVNESAEIVVIGGKDTDIEKYREKARNLEVDKRVHFIGPRPVGNLGDYLAQSDLLISPRTQGTNTPMKIYSYLDSGVAVVATALATHTQVMTEEEAALVEPEAKALASKIQYLLENESERRRLADNARDLVRREHSWSAFRSNVDELFGELDATINEVN